MPCRCFDAFNPLTRRTCAGKLKPLHLAAEAEDRARPETVSFSYGVGMEVPPTATLPPCQGTDSSQSTEAWVIPENHPLISRVTRPAFAVIPASHGRSPAACQHDTPGDAIRSGSRGVSSAPFCISALIHKPYCTLPVMRTKACHGARWQVAESQSGQ